MIAQHLKTGHTSPRPIPLWVSGHSLGAAMASLVYFKLLESPDDLGPDVVLRDAYTFGTPRSVNAVGASAFEYLLNQERNQGRNLWRFANSLDPVAWYGLCSLMA